MQGQASVVLPVTLVLLGISGKCVKPEGTQLWVALAALKHLLACRSLWAAFLYHHLLCLCICLVLAGYCAAGKYINSTVR